MRDLTTSQRWLLAGVIAVGVLMRVGWTVYVFDDAPELTRSQDTPTYVQPARSLANDGEYDTAPGSDVPEFVRTPGYPAYIALVYSVTGESDLAVLVGQGLLSAVTMLLVFALVRRFGASYSFGVLAVLLVVFEPLQFAASGKLLTESLSALCLAASAYCAVRMVQSNLQARWAAALGVALAMSTLVRPTTYYFPAFLALGLIVYGLARRALLRSALVATAAALVPVILVLGAWQLRNHERVDSWRLSGIEAVNLYWYRAAGAISEGDGRPIGQVRLQLTDRINEDLDLGSRRLRRLALGAIPREKRLDQGAYLDKAYSRAVDELRDHPTGFVVMVAKGLAREVGGIGEEYAFSYLRVELNAPLRALLTAILGLFYVLVAIGVYAAGRRRWAARLAHLIVLGLIGYVLVVSAGIEAYSRFRTPVMPLLAVYAALGSATLWARFGQERGARVAVGGDRPPE